MFYIKKNNNKELAWNLKQLTTSILISLKIVQSNIIKKYFNAFKSDFHFLGKIKLQYFPYYLIY